MLTDADLPEGWKIVASPRPDGDELDRLLGLDSRPDRVAHSWDEIESETGQRVLLRMAPVIVEGGRIVADGAKVTAVAILPSPKNDRVTAVELRFPLGSIENAANTRRLALAPELLATLTAGDYTPPDLLGAPDRSDSFYARVALLWNHLAERSDSPTAELRQMHDIPLSTAQRWVTESRKRGYLPPGRRGRAK